MSLEVLLVIGRRRFWGYLDWYHKYHRNSWVEPCCRWVDCVLRSVWFLLIMARPLSVSMLVCLFLFFGLEVTHLGTDLFKASLAISSHEHSSFFHPASYAFYYRIFIEINRSIIIRNLSTSRILYPILAHFGLALRISIWRNYEVWIQNMCLLLWFRILSRFISPFRFGFLLFLSIILMKLIHRVLSLRNSSTN